MMENIEEKKFYQEIRLIFLEVIRAGLKFNNPEIIKTTREIMKEFRRIDKKYKI
ncbi:MAG: hypothetical protein NUV97_02915 [archaeon]|nr:hypothetical protein [archaeon]MCR4343837.1 hypothetical protein [Candidatus Scalindua sp.]